MDRGEDVDRLVGVIDDLDDPREDIVTGRTIGTEGDLGRVDRTHDQAGDHGDKDHGDHRQEILFGLDQRENERKGDIDVPKDIKDDERLYKGDLVIDGQMDLVKVEIEAIEYAVPYRIDQPQKYPKHILVRDYVVFYYREYFFDFAFLLFFFVSHRYCA